VTEFNIGDRVLFTYEKAGHDPMEALVVEDDGHNPHDKFHRTPVNYTTGQFTNRGTMWVSTARLSLLEEPEDVVAAYFA